MATQIKLGRFASHESDAGADEDVGLALAQEDVAEPVEGDEGTGSPIDASETVESELVEAAPAEAEAIEADEEAGDLDEAAVSMENFLFEAQQAAKAGGWSRKEASLVQAGIAAALRPIGYAPVATQMVSTESWAGDNRADLGRTVSLESSIGDLLKQIWEAIKKSVTKMVNYLRTWYLSIFDGAARLKKRAEATKKKADSKGGSAEKKTIPVPNLGALHIDKKVPEFAALKGGLERINHALKYVTSDRLAKEYSDNLEAASEAVEELADGKDTKANATVSALSGPGLKSTLGKLDIGQASGLDKAAERYPTRLDVESTGQLPGGKAIARSADKHEVGGTEVGAPRIDVIDWSDKKVEVESGKEGKALGPGEVVSLCELVIKGLDDIIEYRAGFTKYESKTKSFISKMDTAVKKQVKGEEDSEKANSRKARDLARVLGSIARAEGRSISAITGYAMSTYRATLAYSVSSLAQYKA